MTDSNAAARAHFPKALARERGPSQSVACPPSWPPCRNPGEPGISGFYRSGVYSGDAGQRRIPSAASYSSSPVRATPVAPLTAELRSTEPSSSLRHSTRPASLKLIDPHFNSHSHGPIRRLALDTLDGLRPLQSRCCGSADSRWRRLTQNARPRQDFRFPRSCQSHCGHPRVVSNANAQRCGILMRDRKSMRFVRPLMQIQSLLAHIETM